MRPADTPAHSLVATRSIAAARVPPLVLLAVGAVLVLAFGRGLLAPAADTGSRLVALLFLLPAAAQLLLGVAVTIAPLPLLVRRALAGTALAWLIVLAGGALLRLGSGPPDETLVALAALAAADGLGLLGLALTTRPADAAAGPIARFGAVAAFAIAVVVASAAVVLLVYGALALWAALAEGTPSERVPWIAFVGVLVIPPAAFALAALGTRRAAGRTFVAQAAANRRNSAILLVSLVGIVAATAEIIAASLTFDIVPGLWAAGIAVVVGLLAVVGTDRFGDRLILDATGVRRLDPAREGMLVNVVREVSLAAGMPMPALYVVDDGSQNAFATGRDPAGASLVVTRGLLERMDREQLQGVVAHEIGHIRNLDTRYALYVAILVGLVALVTDGFLRAIVEGWQRGAFFWGRDADDAKEAVGSFVTGLAVGLFLLLVAVLLRLVAPLFSALVQASTSREREYLADATSVELTRNPRGLERALESIAADTDDLEAANRGTQHLWFRNPVKAGSDRRAGLFATHPSLGARIDRLRALQGLGPLEGPSASVVDEET